MPRYESSKLGYRVPARALLHDPERYLYVSERDLSDKARLQQLFTFCGSLEQWALRFPCSTAMPSRAMIAHSAALTSDAGIEKFLDHVNQQLKSFAPFRAASSHIGERAKKEPRPLGGKSGLGRVEVLLNVLMHLSEYVVGTFEWEPSAVNTGGFPAETAEWHRCWQPPDDEVVIFMREHIDKLRKIERECATPMNIRKVQDRLSSLARQVVRDFTKRMTRTDEPVGFKHIKRLPGASGSPDIAKAFHDFAAAVKKIAVVVSERTGPSPYLRQWQEALLHLLEMQEMYSDKCLQLLRPRMTRVGLQKKREQLRGWIAIVAQYLFLVRGNGRCIRFAALCTGVSVAITRVDPRRDRRKVRKRLIELSGFDPLSARYRGFFFTGFFVARLSFFCSAAPLARLPLVRFRGVPFFNFCCCEVSGGKPSDAPSGLTIQPSPLRDNNPSLLFSRKFFSSSLSLSLM